MKNSVSDWLRHELKRRSESPKPEPFDVRGFRAYQAILSTFNKGSAIKWRVEKFTHNHVRFHPILEGVTLPTAQPVPDDPYDDNNPERPYY